MTENKSIKIILHGSLGKTYSTQPIEVYAKTLQEAMQNLISRFGHSFRSTILNDSWHVAEGEVEGDTPSLENSYLGNEDIGLPASGQNIHIFPCITGSGGDTVNILKVVVGVVLVVVGAYFGNPAIVIAGLGLIAGGVTGLLTKAPNVTPTGEGLGQKTSFIFNGAVNNTEQGVPIPLVYGNHLTGSTIISAGIDTIQL